MSEKRGARDERPVQDDAPSLAEYAALGSAAARMTAEQRRHAMGQNSGLTCSKCGCQHFYVVTTKPVKDGIRRYRQCRHCGRRITTLESK